jgi:hypothetical protein
LRCAARRGAYDVRFPRVRHDRGRYRRVQRRHIPDSRQVRTHLLYRAVAAAAPSEIGTEAGGLTRRPILWGDMTDRDSELRTILTRAATIEASRQRARERRDWPRVAQLESELRKLWRRHSELEREGQAA